VIVHHLAIEAREMFDEKIELGSRVILVDTKKEK